jgi:hypothetical protein
LLTMQGEMTKEVFLVWQLLCIWIFNRFGELIFFQVTYGKNISILDSLTFNIHYCNKFVFKNYCNFIRG